MAQIAVSEPHRLTQEEALRRVKRLLGEVQQEFAGKISNLQESWTGNRGQFSFNALGSVSGYLTVTTSQVELSATLPWAAGAFKGTIERTIRERARKLLA